MAAAKRAGNPGGDYRPAYMIRSPAMRSLVQAHAMLFEARSHLEGGEPVRAAELLCEGMAYAMDARALLHGGRPSSHRSAQATAFQAAADAVLATCPNRTADDHRDPALYRVLRAIRGTARARGIFITIS